MRISFLFCLISFLICDLKLTAQKDCKQALIDANKQFESGKISEAVSTIESCGLHDLNKNDRFEAYHLLAIAYQTLNNEQAMDKNIRAMLKLRPDYKRFPNIDPLEFTQALKRYTVRYLLFAGIDLGLNSTGVKLIKSYAVFTSPQRYNPQKSFQLGIFADYRVLKGWGLKAEFSALGLGINHHIDSANGWSQDYNEQQRFRLITLTGFKEFKVYKELKTFVGIGMGINSLYKAQINLITENLQDHSLRLASRNSFDERNKLFITFLPSAGLNYYIAGGYVSMYVASQQFFKNTVIAGKRLDNENFIFNYQYINDDIKLKMLSINVSYSRTLMYKTSKTPRMVSHANF